MDYYNQLVKTIRNSSNFITEADITKAEELLNKYHNHWQYVNQILNLNISLGAKYHYLYHCVEYIKIWGVPLGFNNEQSVESFHKICSAVMRRYYNQRGLLKVKYSIRQLMVITSPLYHN